MPTGVFRTLLLSLIVCIFNLAAIGIFAQEEPATSSAASPTTSSAAQVEEAQAVDPITAAERALSLDDSGTGIAQPIPGTSVLSILRVLLTLAVVAAAIYGIVFFIKRLSRGSTAQDPFLKTLASTPLGLNRSAHIVSVGSRAWLVGAAESGVSLISEIDDQDILNEMLLENSRKSAETPAGRFPDFRALLGRLGMKVESSSPSPESIRKRSERLKGL